MGTCDERAGTPGRELAMKGWELPTQVPAPSRGGEDLPFTEVPTGSGDRGSGLQTEVPTQVPIQVPSHPGRQDRVAVTFAINGAEELVLVDAAVKLRVSVQTYVMTRCGFDLWRLDAARERPALPPRRRPVRQGLERRSVTIWPTRAQYDDLYSRSNEPGLSVPQFIRTLCGFRVRWASLPGTEAREEEMDDAWDRLQRLGLEPKKYIEE